MQKLLRSKKIVLGDYENKKVSASLASINLKGDRIYIFEGSLVRTQPNLIAWKSGKFAKVEFDLSEISNGYYEYTEALKNGDLSVGYLKIESGVIAQEWETKWQLLAHLQPIIAKLPVLQGTIKQVSWAESIRSLAICRGLDLEEAIAIVSAEVWINNRDRLVALNNLSSRQVI